MGLANDLRIIAHPDFGAPFGGKPDPYALPAQIIQLQALVAEQAEEIRQLKQMLRPQTLFTPDWCLFVPEMRLLGLLYQRGTVSYEQAEIAVMVGNKTLADYKDAGMLARQRIHTLRGKLKRHGIRIDNIRTIGWSIDAENRKKVAAGIVASQL